MSTILIEANRILDQLNTDAIVSNLTNQPGDVVAKRASVREARKVYDEVKGDLELVEAEISSEIEEELEIGTTKKRYSNAESRRSELLKRRICNPDWNDANQRLRIVEANLNHAEDELYLAETAYRSTLFVSDLISSKISVIGGVVRREAIREELNAVKELFVQWEAGKKAA